MKSLLHPKSVEYAGLWRRAVASILDILLYIIIAYPVQRAVYGPQYLEREMRSFVAGPIGFAIIYIVPAVATIILWRYKRATPGKMLTSLQVVDFKTGESLSIKQSCIRYASYYLSILPLGLGYFWILINKDKRTWHDLLSGSAVVKL